MEVYRVPVADRDHTRAGLALHLVAACLGVAMRAVADERRNPDAMRTRRLAMYLAHIGYGWTVERVAHAFGVSRATSARACAWSEDQRDQPAVDALLDTLEGCLGKILAGDHGGPPA